MSLYNHRKNEFSNFFYKNKGQNVTVRNIVPMQKDWLMLGTTEGILLFDVKGERFLLFLIRVLLVPALSDIITISRGAFSLRAPPALF